MYSHLDVQYNPQNPFEGLRSPLEVLLHWERTRPDEICMRQPFGKEWHTFTWKEALRKARKMAAAIKAMNLPEGSRIGIFSKNCNYWMLADFAIMLSGHISVPLYPPFLMVHTKCFY